MNYKKASCCLFMRKRGTEDFFFQDANLKKRFVLEKEDIMPILQMGKSEAKRDWLTCNGLTICV